MNAQHTARACENKITHTNTLLSLQDLSHTPFQHEHERHLTCVEAAGSLDSGARPNHTDQP
jgi:hypothetical protein